MGRYKIKLSEKAVKDFRFYKKSGNKKVVKSLETIYEELKVHPFIGTGKPEALKYELSGLWSRRLDGKNRIVYKVDEGIVTVIVVTAKGHYE